MCDQNKSQSVGMGGETSYILDLTTFAYLLITLPLSPISPFTSITSFACHSFPLSLISSSPVIIMNVYHQSHLKSPSLSSPLNLSLSLSIKDCLSPSLLYVPPCAHLSSSNQLPTNFIYPLITHNSHRISSPRNTCK